MAQLIAMQQQLAAQSQAESAGKPDVAAMMAELEALRAQVAAQSQAAPAVTPKKTEVVEKPTLEDIVKEFSQSEENEE